MSDLLDLAGQVVDRAKALGASEVAAIVSEGSHVTILRRGGQVEQASEATTRGLVVSVLANDRYTSNSTSDLRPDALEAFLVRCVESAAYLEPDPDRALPPGELCGRGVSEEQLDQLDPAHAERTAEDRAEYAARLESAITDQHDDQVISSAAYAADGFGHAVRVMSNGFSDESKGAWFASGGEMTLREGERRPESAAYYGARHLSDLPDVKEIADEVIRRTRERLGAAPIASGSYPMILENRLVGQMLGILGGAMSGGAIHHGQSFLAGKVGSRIGSELLTVVDDPTLPRGLGSRPWDGDALIARKRTVIDKGVLTELNIDTYYGRKLGLPPTSGGRSNWVLPTGDQSWAELSANYPKAVRVTGFLGGNANGTTGDFSFGIRGVLVENGEITQSLGEMNVSGNAIDLFERLVALADDPWGYGSVIAPTLIFEGIDFSGT